MTDPSWRSRFLAISDWAREYVKNYAPEKLADFDEAAKTMDGMKLWAAMNRAWFRGPERTHPNWGLMCDLLSENPIIKEETPHV